MATEELDTLRAEAAVKAAELAAEADPETTQEVPPSELMPPVDPGVATALSAASLGICNIICRRANVTTLEREEAELMGNALAQLVAVYDIGPTDPKGAAWMGFGMACVAIIGNRQRLPDKQPGEAAVPEPAEVPPAPVFGSTGVATLSEPIRVP